MTALYLSGLDNNIYAQIGIRGADRARRQETPS